MKILWNSVYMIETGRFLSSSPCWFLNSLPCRLKGSQKSKSSGCALLGSLDSQDLQVACPWYWTYILICSQF